MRRRQFMALLLVAIMAVAMIPAATIAAKEVNPAPATQKIVGAYRTPSLSASSTPWYPTRSKTYTVYGYLTYSGVGLASRDIQVWWKYPKETTYTYWKTITTNAYGRYSFTDWNSKYRYCIYLMIFPGDTTYNSVLKTRTVWSGRTYTTISNPFPVRLSTPFDLHGYVRDGYGNGLAGYEVVLWERTFHWPNWGSWERVYDLTGHYATDTTDSNGYYKLQYLSAENEDCMQYEAVFLGYPLGGSQMYWSSYADVDVCAVR